VPHTSFAYRALLRTASALAPLAGLIDEKLARTVALRRGVLERLAAWGRASRNTTRPLAWFHAPSVGEGLQAKAVMQAFRARHPDWQVAYTYFSPSAQAFAASIGADVADCLPFDTPDAVAQTLDALRPSLLVFAKLDVWPELATRAARAGIPVALVAATVRPGSGRLRRVARALLAPGYQALSIAGAISADDAELLARLGVPRDRIHIAGDPRCDSVLARVAAVRDDEPLLALGSGAPTLVAGSTWPVDEDHLLAAFVTVLGQHPEARLILVPHEPSAEALERIQHAAERVGAPPARVLGAVPEAGPLVVANRLGVLATLYGAGTLAYVGGGFGRAGLHSVLEPAAWGLPVMFGPHWEESRDAGRLIAGGGGVAAANAGALADQWLKWLEDDWKRAAMGGRALEAVESERGASVRLAALLDELA
jgi:3-deoxy-D-manno-octulosonic-acid transferase